MNRLLGIFLALAVAVPAYAGFRAYNGTTDLDIFDAIKCSTGLTCTRVGGKLNIVSSPTVSAAELTVQGAEATDGILNIISDESDDSGDDWAVKAVASGNALAISNNVSGALINKMTLSTGGALGLLGSEAGDGVLTISSDESDDSGDDWAFTVAASGNALTVSNDTSGAQVAKLVLTTGGALYGSIQNQVASTTAAITAAQCGSTFLSNSADVMALPEASTVLGCQLTFICGTADDFDINPDDADVIGPALNSVAGGTGAAITPSAGDAIRCTDIGSSIMIQAVGAALWAPVGVGNGAWTDVN
jgi:hypothetical protein